MKTTIALLGLTLLLGAPALAADNIDGKTARALVKEQKAVLVDVRTDEEFKARHVEGAVNIPVEELQDRLAELPDKQRTVVVYCKSGARSAKALSLLKAAGYAKVHNLGSLNNW